MDLVNLYRILSEKYGNSENIADLTAFYFLLEKYGTDPVKKMYSDAKFCERFSLLDQADIFKTENDSDSKLFFAQFNQLNFSNIEWLRYFVIYGETNNINRTANLLKITPQGLIKAISCLEKHFKINLIDDKKNSRQLTKAGKEFLNRSRKIIHLIYDMEQYFKDICSEETEETLTIGWDSIWGLSVLPETISGFVEKFPKVYAKIYMIDPENIEAAVAVGEMDIGLLARKPVRKELAFVECSKIPYVIVGKPQKFKPWNELEYIVPVSFEPDITSSSPWPERKYKRLIIAEADTGSLPVVYVKKV